MEDIDLQQQAQTVLEWDRILEILAQEAHSSMGVERCRTLPLESTLEGAQHRLQETAELISLQEQGLSFPTISFPDIREALSRAQKGATLEPHELRDCSIILHLSTDVGRFLEGCQEFVTSLKSLAYALSESTSLEDLKEEIDASVDQEGTIRESATPELRHHSQHVHDLKQQMRRPFRS